jgi:hypothetical protein
MDIRPFEYDIYIADWCNWHPAVIVCVLQRYSLFTKETRLDADRALDPLRDRDADFIYLDNKNVILPCHGTRSHPKMRWFTDNSSTSSFGHAPRF